MREKKKGGDRVKVSLLYLNSAVTVVSGILVIFLVIVLIRYHIKSRDRFRFADSVSGAKNRSAFIRHLEILSSQNLVEYMYAVKIDNLKTVSEIYGADSANSIVRSLISSLRWEFGDDNVYRLDGSIFIVTFREKYEKSKCLERIRKILNRIFHVNGTEIRLSYCTALTGTENNRPEDVISSIDYGLMRAGGESDNRYYEVGENALGNMTRYKAIEQAINDCIKKDHFEVHYQPIYDLAGCRYHSLEALVRLNVPGYGYVSPEEFIKMAEKDGTILDIGLIVMREVCRFIKENELKKYGIEFVEVNLSVVQCMQNSIYHDLRKIMEEYEIPFEMINLEITESAAAYSEKRLVRNMAKLSLMNVSFSLDDYGSGYSNINYITDLPFSIIKIDKFFLWSAVKKGNSRKILDYTIKMFKEISLKVVVEGVEDEEMLDMVKSMGADYIQGFYFSKPLKGDALLSLLAAQG